MPPRVLVTLPLPESALEPLHNQYEVDLWERTEPQSEVDLIDRLQVAEGVLCSLGTKISAEAIRRSPKLRVISSVSVGVDHIDVSAATQCGVPIGHTPGVLVDSTADLALTLMLAVTRRITEADQFVRAGQWHTGWAADFFLGTDLSRATVGIVGMGPIGQAVAQRLRGFGAKIIAWNRSPKSVPGVEWVGLDALFAHADIVSLHTALTADTRGFVSQRRLAAMRDGATLINTARGGLVDESALIAELASGRLRAGLDVFYEEPLVAGSALFGLKNAVLAPHIGSATAATRDDMLSLALDNLVAGMLRKRLARCVNPEAYALQ